MRKHTLAAGAALIIFAGSNVATVQAESARPGAAQVTSTTPEYSLSMHELLRAAQQLRVSIQDLAQHAPGPRRDSAMKAAREALNDTQQAMMRLPPELRTGGPTPAGVAPRYEDTMRHLQWAANRLYDAVHAMAGQPAGARRNAAVSEVNEALVETHTAMMRLPNHTRSSAAASADETTSGAGMTSSRAPSATVDGYAVIAGPDDTPVAGAAPAVAGGVGLNARAMLSADAAPDHNVKMVFSLDSGNYVADVHVQVEDSAGRTVIDGVSDGPWLYAKLPPGRYSATATYGGTRVTRKFSVGDSGQRVAHFRWPVSVERQASADLGVNAIFGTGQ